MGLAIVNGWSTVIVPPLPTLRVDIGLQASASKAVLSQRNMKRMLLLASLKDNSPTRP